LASSLYVCTELEAWTWVLPGMRKRETSLPASPSQWKLEDPRQKSPTHALSPQDHEPGENASNQPLRKP